VRICQKYEFKVNDLILLHENKFDKFPRKF